MLRVVRLVHFFQGPAPVSLTLVWTTKCSVISCSVTLYTFSLLFLGLGFCHLFFKPLTPICIIRMPVRLLTFMTYQLVAITLSTRAHFFLTSSILWWCHSWPKKVRTCTGAILEGSQWCQVTTSIQRNRVKVIHFHPCKHNVFPETHSGRRKMWNKWNKGCFETFLAQRAFIRKNIITGRKINIINRTTTQRVVHIIPPVLYLLWRGDWVSCTANIYESNKSKERPVAKWKQLARASLSPAHLIYTSDLNSPVNSTPQSVDLKAVKTSEKTENAASFCEKSKGTHEEAEMEKAGSSNITFGDTTMAVLEFLEDTATKKTLTRGHYWH